MRNLLCIPIVFTVLCFAISIGYSGVTFASVENTFPAANALHTDADIDISIVFDTPMNPATLENSTVVVCGSYFGQYHGLISYDSLTMTATFDPNQDFGVGEIVTVVLTTSIEEIDSTPLDPGYAWQFTIDVNELSPGTFQEDVAYSVGDYPTDVVAVDLDDDGDLDLACANYLAAHLSVLMNDGSGHFSSFPDLPNANQPISICAADFDFDGDLDLAAPSANAPIVSVHLNNGDGTFASRIDFSTCGNQSRGSAAADFDADGDIDLAVASMSGCLAILYNDGAADFSTVGPYGTHGDSHDLYAADYDNDGDLDIAASNKYTSDISVCYNNGSGGFSTRTDYPSGDYCLRITAADLDADGDQDLVAGTYPTDVVVFWNLGGGDFANTTSYDIGNNAYSLIPGDLDGDDDIDIFTGGDQIGVLWNHEEAGIEHQALYPYCPMNADQSSFADIDGDGDLDITITNNRLDEIIVLFNEYSSQGISIQCPADLMIPSGTIPSIELSSYIFTNTSAESLAFSYEITEETVPADANIVFDAPDSSLISGTTELVAPGAVCTLSTDVVLLIPTIRDPAGFVTEVVTCRVSAVARPCIMEQCATTIIISLPVPVLISNFTANEISTGVKLEWDIVGEDEIKGFKLYRQDKRYKETILLTSNGLISCDERSFVDENINEGATYYYTLCVEKADGSEVRSSTLEIKTRSSNLALNENYPNPFNPTTTISFTLPEKMRVNLSVFDIEGALVRTLVDGLSNEGLREVMWDGKNSSGNSVSSGVYFYRLKAGNRALTKKMVLLK